MAAPAGCGRGDDAAQPDAPAGERLRALALGWLRDEPIQALRALIRKHDLDPARRTSKWKEAEKLSEFIADNLRSRLARGASFLGRQSSA